MVNYREISIHGDDTKTILYVIMNMNEEIWILRMIEEAILQQNSGSLSLDDDTKFPYSKYMKTITIITDL
ncbi:16930_t:CDS:2 [Funneliformis mosseae]|uniref:16930_t:CDS:1 n=1 Tax=Funneliformis mosseae TaxID=27381 RepID=A0A9N9C206_FUNMO|nr:16930_t:CDS:2 [Funneliformis mosseae]